MGAVRRWMLSEKFACLSVRSGSSDMFRFVLITVRTVATPSAL